MSTASVTLGLTLNEAAYIHRLVLADASNLDLIDQPSVFLAEELSGRLAELIDSAIERKPKEDAA